jgi:hypothetical protein
MAMKRMKMNDLIRSALCGALIATMVLPPSAMGGVSRVTASDPVRAPVTMAASAAVAPEAPKNTVLRTLLDSVASRYERILSKVPSELLQDVETGRTQEIDQAVAEKLSELKSGQKTVAQFRQEMLETSLSQLKEQKQEIFYQIHNLEAEQLDAIAEAMKGNPDYRDAWASYQAAYTRTEKANALTDAVMLDLDHLTSMLTKRSHRMSQADWERDLNGVQGMYNTKGSSKKWLKAVGIAVLGVAAVGLITWGVASSVYGRKLDRVRDQREAQYRDLQSRLETEYNAYAQKLDQDEKDYLRDHGFVLTTCGTYQMPDSIICNRYDYQVFQGTRFCSVQCYKNLTTGQETLHQPTTCTSPFIPADCYDPSEYDQGYNDGYSDNYDPGHAAGTNDGAYDGAQDGADDGDSDGYNDGYNEGYSSGYDDGYGKRLELRALLAPSPEWQRGFDDGLSDARTLRAVLAGGM